MYLWRCFIFISPTSGWKIKTCGSL